MLSLTLFYGCRAFDPEPVIVNLAPETFLIGGPAEDTGTGFRRHLYWYGTDRDGDVVQFIYAITDTTVRDDEFPTEDEEDRRFNPALDITTVTESEGFVGWTAKTDSVFIFTIDRESEVSKQVTFHIVAVDDRGEIDPTPARLRFFNNASGQPRIKFRVYTGNDMDPRTGEGGELRWVGDPLRGPDADSPEQTSEPYVGFQRPFRIEWEASTPNAAPEFGDPIIGYRYKAIQGTGLPFTPDVDDSTGAKLFDPDQREFFFGNFETNPDSLGPSCEVDDGDGCKPSTYRWPSGSFTLSVEVLDRALVQNSTTAGQLDVQVNYPPQTIIEPVATYVVRDEGDNVLLEGTFREGDTIPHLSEVTFVSRGFDRFEDTVPDSVGTDRLCCDFRVGTGLPDVRFTERVSGTRITEEDEAGLDFTGVSGQARESGTVSFLALPYQYTYTSTTVDELGRFDNEAADFSFDVGFEPSLRPELGLPDPARDIDRVIVNLSGVVEGDSLVIGAPQFTTGYLIPDAAAGECGARLVFDPDEIRPDEEPFVTEFGGFRYRLGLRFVGQNDPRDPLGTIRSWSFTLNSVNDPTNSIQDGLESPDLRVFREGTAPNVLDFRENPVASNPDAALSFFVPLGLLQTATAGDFDADSEIEASRQIGCLLSQRLGEMELAYRGRVTAEVEDELDFFRNRDLVTREDISPYGAKSETYETTFSVFVHIDVNGNGQVDPENGDRLWPDEATLGRSTK